MHHPLRILLFASLILFMLIVILVGLNWGDEPPPDDADLLPVPKVVRAEDNGYPLLMEAIAALDGVSDSTRLSNLAEDGSDDEWLRKELERDDEALRLFTEATARPAIVLPKLSPLDLRDGLGSYRELARLVVARARVNLRKGEQEDGLADILMVTGFGRRLAEGGGALIDFLTSNALQSTALAALREEAPHLHLNPEQTQNFLRALEKERFPREAFASTLRAEYVYTKEGCDSLMGRYGPWYQGFGYMIKPNKSLRLAGEQTREWISLVDEPVYSHADWPDDDIVFERSLPFENEVGRMMVKIMAPTVSKVMLAAFLLEANFGSTQLLVALSAFEKAEGELPESLDELVGVWIDAIPLDPFSGGALRYSKAHRLVFSVGPDVEEDPASVDTSGKGIIRGFIVPELSVPQTDQ